MVTGLKILKERKLGLKWKKSRRKIISDTYPIYNELRNVLRCRTSFNKGQFKN